MTQPPVCPPRTCLGAIVAALLIACLGCDRPSAPPPGDLPPAYTRDKILDRGLAEAARAFTTWAREQRVGSNPVFASVNVLPPAPTLLPYGVGNYQKEIRLPAIIITGPGWRALSGDEREAMAGQTFEELSRRLQASARETRVLATITIQTPQGLELCWINNREPGRKLLHGEDD
jgi:hypothetical protein